MSNINDLTSDEVDGFLKKIHPEMNAIQNQISQIKVPLDKLSRAALAATNDVSKIEILTSKTRMAFVNAKQVTEDPESTPELKTDNENLMKELRKKNNDMTDKLNAAHTRLFGHRGEMVDAQGNLLSLYETMFMSLEGVNALITRKYAIVQEQFKTLQKEVADAKNVTESDAKNVTESDVPESDEKIDEEVVTVEEN